MIPKGKIHTFIFTQKPPWLSRSKSLKRIENEVEIEGLVANVLGELFYPQQSQRLEKSASRSSALMFRDTLHFRLCCPFP